MKIITVLLASSILCSAQNVAVLTYEFANPQAVADGCPKDWPYSIKRIGDATQLPAKLAAPWKVISEADLKVYMEANAAAKEAFNNREAPDVTTRRQMASDIINELKNIRASTGTLTAAELWVAVRRLARALLFLIEEGKLSLNP